MERGAKRNAILQAGRTALLESGAAGITLEQVLKPAGAGTGTFYHHFPDGRGQLVAEVYAAAHAEYADGVMRVLRRNRDAQPGVKALVHHHVRLFQTDQDLMRVLLHNRGSEVPAAGRALERAVQAWAGAAGLPRQSAAELLALWLGPVLELGRISPGSVAGAADRLAQAAWDAVSRT